MIVAGDDVVDLAGAGAMTDVAHVVVALENGAAKGQPVFRESLLPS